MMKIKILKTGKWLRFNNKTCMCSICGQGVLRDNIEHYKYCFNCGAKMKIEWKDNKE